MDAIILAAYNASRKLTGKGFPSQCYAPHTSLYFNTQGDVRVCCHNRSFPAGNIATQTIAEIWNGDAIKRIRRSLECGSFAQGCGYCEWQLATGSFVNISTRYWDGHPVESKDPEWPLQMEFSISNTCNLECIMCNGMASSAIRAHREKLPPVHNPYSDGFFSELRAYLPRLRKARFLGGEPFLQAACSRIWSMLIEDGIELPCHVTTNATQYNARIEKFLERIPFGFAISLDGYRRETIEKIRVNANYDILMRNVNRFRSYTRKRNQPFDLTYCLMRPNWEEFGEFCLFADSLECGVFVNAVRRPPELSLYTLSPAELGQIADAMEAQAERVVPLLDRNRAVWTGEVARLRARASGQSPMIDHAKVKTSSL
jgi:MoaA/NifB/PqqE/SkfB family radical SAM enzyme